MMPAAESLESEDILSKSLEFLGGEPVIDDSKICYGPLVLSLAPKEGKANTLLADHLFSPALFLAERIERGLLDVEGRTVIELGAGSALPSLLLSTLPRPPSLVVVTDYPDEGIMRNLNLNVERNSHLVTNRSALRSTASDGAHSSETPPLSHSETEGCAVRSLGYDWGTDASDLLGILSSSGESSPGYDIMILSDLLHFHSSHDALVSSIDMLLVKSKHARIYVGAGVYTRPHVCESFLEKGRAINLDFEEIVDEGEEKKWLGTLAVSNLDREALQIRKDACRYWVGRWSEASLKEA
ncbi:hypothetical protein B0H34DRAFT_500555 [Crassisporium funariophilum]|nr:hypothetical protein B0H34DRAFT_500555 [Crassisporium funariophilum]